MDDEPVLESLAAWGATAICGVSSVRTDAADRSLREHLVRRDTTKTIARAGVRSRRRGRLGEANPQPSGGPVAPVGTVREPGRRGRPGLARTSAGSPRAPRADSRVRSWIDREAEPVRHRH